MANEENEKQRVDEFTMSVDAGELAKANPDNFGGEFRRHAIGDFKFRCVDAWTETKKGDKPHVMLVLDWQSTHAYGAEKDGVGETITARYAGSPQSPKMMQDSRARLLRSLGINGGTLSKKSFIGREVDASVIWTLAKPRMNTETGELQQTVFTNITCERPVGSKRPETFDPARESAKAVKYLADKYGESDDAPEETPPWAAPSGGLEQPAGAASNTPSWRDEAEADPTVHQYRAHVKMATPHAELARTTLVGQGWDPDGPINADHLGDMKAAYHAAFPPAPSGGLPGLPSLPATNGAAPASAPKARTGTRQPRTT